MKGHRTIGYFVPEFPSQTHTFFWREAKALSDAGVSLTHFSTRRPAPEACPHAFGAEARERTRYIFPPRLPLVLPFLLRRPFRTFRSIRYVFGLSETPIRSRLRLLALILSAADLAIWCRKLGIRHVHIHSFANSAHVGSLANILDGLGYSLTLHGDLPVYGTDHAAKIARASVVTAVTRPLADQIRAIDSRRPVPVIWMGVDVDRFAPPEQPVMQREMPLTVLTVARLNRAKGHHYLLEALKLLRDEGIRFRYQIVGEGPEKGGDRKSGCPAWSG